MFHNGLVSITCRQLSPQQIIDLVVQAGLEGIEWGGDIHVPHGDVVRAKEVRRRTLDAGLRVVSYGSYYHLDHPDTDASPFDAVLDTAIALGAPVVRVWAGNLGSAQTAPATRRQIVRESRYIADLAQQAGIVIAYEFHARTLTDSNESALRLLQEVDHPNVATYWQPMRHVDEAYRLEGLNAVLPWLAHLHVFSWSEDGTRLPLADGEALWRRRLEIVARSGRDHDVLIEFVRDDDPEAFLQDAATLKRWLQAASANPGGLK